MQNGLSRRVRLPCPLLTVVKLTNPSTHPPTQPQTSAWLRRWAEQSLTINRKSLRRKWQATGRRTPCFQAFRAPSKRANSLQAAISGCTKPPTSTQFYHQVSSCSLPAPLWLICGESATLKLSRRTRGKSSLERIAQQAGKPSCWKIKVASSTSKRRSTTAK